VEVMSVDYDNFVFGAFFGLACGALASLFVFNFWQNRHRADRYSYHSILLARLNELTNRELYDDSIESGEEE